jgi:hypothetical protein
MMRAKFAKLLIFENWTKWYLFAILTVGSLERLS